MPANIDYSDVTHAGQHKFEKTPTVPAGSWGDTQMGTANPVDPTKLKHQYAPAYGQPHGIAAVTERRVIHVARSAGTVQAAEAGHVVAGVTGATLTVDLKKNGTTVLSAVISLVVDAAAYTRVTGSISSAAYVAGDVFELVITATAGGGTLPQGVFADVVFREGSG